MNTAERDVDLVEALAARGFSRRVSVRVQMAPHRKIQTIKEVRTLTHMGLREAKDAVEQSLLILRAVPPSHASEAQRALQSVGGDGHIEHAEAHLYAFDPRDPLRGAQAREHLAVLGREVVHTRGPIGAELELERAQPSDDDALLGWLDARRSAWARAGLVEVADDVEFVARASAHNEALEARIDAASDETLPAELAVYGDWLLAQGDPRGQIAAAASSLAAATDDVSRHARSLELDALLERHALHLFGPAPRLHAAPNRLRFAGPLVVHATLHALPDGDPTLLERLLDLPIFSHLRSLCLSGPLLGQTDLAAVLGQGTRGAHLRHLEVVDAHRVRFAGLSLPRLEQLELDAGEIEFADLHAPRLARLDMQLASPGRELVQSFAGLDAPALEQLRFTTEAYDFWDQQHGPLQRLLEQVFALPSFARLRRLELGLESGSVPFQIGLAELLTRMPARATLEHIDLSRARLSPAARVELERLDAFPDLLLPDPNATPDAAPFGDPDVVI